MHVVTNNSDLPLSETKSPIETLDFVAECESDRDTLVALDRAFREGLTITIEEKAAKRTVIHTSKRVTRTESIKLDLFGPSPFSYYSKLHEYGY